MQTMYNSLMLQILFKQVLIMYILMFFGYFAYKKKLLSDQGSKEIGNILVSIVIPVIVISNFCIERTDEKVIELLHASIITFICMIICFVISIGVFHSRNRIDEFSSAFSNAGFIGIPLVQSIFGDNAIFYISILIVLVGVFQWTYGVYTITDDKKFININKIIRNPIMISVFIGLIIFSLNIKMPPLINTIFTQIGAMNTPLAMMVCGVYLAQSDIASIIKKKHVYVVSLFRLIIIPLITILFLKFIPIGNSTMKLSILLACAAPVGANVAIFASLYDKDYKRGIENVCVSTLLCILTLPFIMYIASLFIS